MPFGSLDGGTTERLTSDRGEAREVQRAWFVVIEPQSPNLVVVHAIGVARDQRAQVVALSGGTVAFVYGDDQLDEVTLVVRARCPVSGDVLDLPTCDCTELRERGLSVARRAPLGAFVYLPRADGDAYANVLVVLSHLLNVERVFVPFAGAGDVAFIRETSNYDVVHRPTRLPDNDPTWPLADRRARSPRERVVKFARDLRVEFTRMFGG